MVRPWHEYVEGLRYMRSVPLILGLAMVNVGWATGGGAAQILFTRFRRDGIQSRPRRPGPDLGMRRELGCCAAARWRTRSGRRLELRELQARDGRLLHRARRLVHSLQPDAQLSAGAGVHRALARGRGLQLGDEHVAIVAPRSRSIPRPRVRHHGNHHVVGDDDLDAAGRRGIASIGIRAPSARSPARSVPRPRSSGAGRTSPAAYPSRRAKAWSPRRSRFMANRTV